MNYTFRTSAIWTILLLATVNTGCSDLLFSGPRFDVSPADPLGTAERIRAVLVEKELHEQGPDPDNIVGWGSATLFIENTDEGSTPGSIAIIISPEGQVVGIHARSRSNSVSPSLDILHGLWTEVCGESPSFRVAQAGGMTGEPSMTAECKGDIVSGKWNRFGGSGHEAVLLVLTRNAGYAMQRMEL